MSQLIRIHEVGGPDVLRVEEADLPAPGAGEARVRHEAIGLNFIDTYHRSGLYALPLPSGLGMEGAGVVEAIGPQVQEVSVGDRVGYAAGPPGAYASERLIRADRLVRLPDDIDAVTAAAAMLKGMTVEYLIRRVFPVKAGMTVLFHAAAGGVGLIACQWLAHLGATVIGTVGSDEKAELAREHGCTHPIVYTREDFVQRVRELTDGRGVPVVFDSVGRATFMGSLDCLRKRGMIVGFGNASGKPEPFDITLLAAKGSLFATRPVLMDYTEARADLEASAGALFEVLRSKAVRIDVRQRFALTDAAQAHRVLESRRTVGSSVLLP
jgi:NADPH:quinone reductase